MSRSRILALVAASARRARLVLVLAVVLALAGAALALRLHASAATSTFVSSSSGEYKDTQRYYQHFGEEPIAVLVHGSLQKLVLSSDLLKLAGLEGCLSGRVPAAALAQEGGANGPCGQLARARTVKVVFGPGTFVAEAARQINEELNAQTKQAQTAAKQAEQVVRSTALGHGLGAARANELGREASRVTIARFQEGLVALALQYGITSRPSIEDHEFVSAVVFDSTKPAGTPKQRFAYLFPGREAALISVRMRSGLSESQRRRTIALVRSAVAMPQWHLANGETYVVTGVPVIVADLVDAIGHAVLLLMAAVVLVMAAALGLVFTGRPRLLPLVLALLACALTFGALALAGAPLTMASVAVLPVLVGLAVDYAIQFQSRVAEAGVETGGTGPAALIAGARAGAGTIVTAGAASAAAMLALLLSPVPMVQGFGLLLVAGVAIALLCTLAVGTAALSTLPPPGRSGRARRHAGTPLLARLAAAWRGAGELVRESPLTRLVSGAALGAAVRRPGRVLCVGLVLAAAGWALDTQTSVQTDLPKLVPQGLASLQGLDTLERTTGVAGEIDLLVSGRNVTAPATIEWMSRYQTSVLARFGYSASRGCGRARLCPAFSLPDLFAQPASSSGRPAKLSSKAVQGLLSAIPPYFSQDVVSPDHRFATLAFGIRVMSLQQQEDLIERMRSSLHPPAGVSASLVGLPVLAAHSGSQVADPWRRLATLIVSLALVALVLLLAFRGDRRRALTPLVPIVLATGWSALVLYALRVPLNPMSVTLGSLVIAISTEFSVLLSERFRQELAGSGMRAQRVSPGSAQRVSPGPAGSGMLAGSGTGAERLSPGPAQRVSPGSAGSGMRAQRVSPGSAGSETIAALRRTYARTGAAVGASGVTAIAGFGVLALSDIRMLRDFGLVTLVDLTVSLLGVLIALPATLVIAERGAPAGFALRSRRGAAAGRAQPPRGAASESHEPA
ncbi:MAG TPA: MMPL family transporter [Solirubrobacteraceae bacterium]|nr:MMPL family transporter [Solirubrobacteraceae bacterium]